MHFLTFAYIRLLPPGRSLCSYSICLGCFVSAQPALAGAGENSNVCQKYFLFLEFFFIHNAFFTFVSIRLLPPTLGRSLCFCPTCSGRGENGSVCHKYHPGMDGTGAGRGKAKNQFQPHHSVNSVNSVKSETVSTMKTVSTVSTI